LTKVDFWAGPDHVLITFTIQLRKLPKKSPKMSVVSANIISMLSKRNEARRKAESQALFQAMLKEGKKQVVVPKKYKGTRQSKLREALDNQ
jgi:hypothetical protein